MVIRKNGIGLGISAEKQEIGINKGEKVTIARAWVIRIFILCWVITICPRMAK